MILGPDGKPARKVNGFTVPEWIQREAAARIAERCGFAREELAEMRVADLRETVAQEQERTRHPAELGAPREPIGVRFLEEYDIRPDLHPTRWPAK